MRFRRPIRLFRLTHLFVVLTNVLQLVCMITFLVLLLMKLNEDIAVSWFAVFASLWTSDAITTITGVQEMRRLCAPGESRRFTRPCLRTARRRRRGCPSRGCTGHREGRGWSSSLWASTPAHSAPHHPARQPQPSLLPSRRNPIINQINRFKGCLCVATFKLLLALRLDGVLPDLPIRIVCVPYYFAAVLRCVLHFAKEPITPPDGAAQRSARPGTPINPVHVMIIVLACRVDGLHPFGPTWAATFWPMWLLFGVLVLASLGAGCLAIGILVTREPRERGYALTTPLVRQHAAHRTQRTARSTPHAARRARQTAGIAVPTLHVTLPG